MPIKVAFMQLSSCWGCHQSLLNAHLGLLPILPELDIVYWPAVVDYKRESLIERPDKDILVGFIEGVARTKQDTENAKLITNDEFADSKSEDNSVIESTEIDFSDAKLFKLKNDVDNFATAMANGASKFKSFYKNLNDELGKNKINKKIASSLQMKDIFLIIGKLNIK